MRETNTPLLHTIEQARTLLACGRNTVYNLVNRNELTMIKMGRRSLITHKSIREYVDRKVREAEYRSSLNADPTPNEAGRDQVSP
jgi:excisionase family DNA binding protein